MKYSTAPIVIAILWERKDLPQFVPTSSFKRESVK